MSLWHIPALRFAAADSRVALEQIARLVRDENLAEPGVVETRRAEIAAANAERRAALDALEQPGADLPGIAAAAGGAYGVTVADPGELPRVLADALAVVHGGRSAVVSVHLPPAQAAPS